MGLEPRKPTIGIKMNKIKYKLQAIKKKIQGDSMPGYIINLGFGGFELQQRRAALVYLTSPFHGVWKYPRPNETNIKILLGILLEKGYIVDVYDFNYNPALSSLKVQPYDLIFGFGKCFDELCLLHPSALKVMFAVEMPPWQMRAAESTAIAEIRARGINSESVNMRSNLYYTDENFLLPDFIIAMGSTYNKTVIEERFRKPILLIDCSVPIEQLDYLGSIPKVTNSFAWVGSNGATMKGLHRIIKFFEQHEHFTLHIFGLSKADKKILKSYKVKNMIDHGFVDLRDEQFQKIISEQIAVISASYSEGMQTSIATALSLGTKAIVTPQCGYTEQDLGVLLTTHDDLEATLISYSVSDNFHINLSDITAIRKRYSAASFRKNIMGHMNYCGI
jgi:hypothetical protein